MTTRRHGILEGEQYTDISVEDRKNTWTEKPVTESQIRSIKQHSTILGWKKVIPKTRGEAALLIGTLHYLLEQRAEISRESNDKVLRELAKFIQKRRKELKNVGA